MSELFMDTEGCVFIIGVDRQVIEMGIEVHYRHLGLQREDELPISGSKYLEKMVQLPFSLPP